MLEEYIASALEAPNAAYSYLTEGDVFGTRSWVPHLKSDQKVKADSRQILNRAKVLNTQAARLRTLCSEMSFAAALKQSREKMQFLQTTQSFDDVTLRASSKVAAAASKAADLLHASPLLKHVMGTMLLNETNEAMPEQVAY